MDTLRYRTYIYCIIYCLLQVMREIEIVSYIKPQAILNHFEL